MKKTIFGFIALAVILASCQNQSLDESINDGAGQLNFSIYQGTSTRAAELMNADLRVNGKQVAMKAYKGVQSGVKTLYFNETLTYGSPIASQWNTSIPRFMPQSDPLQLYAYYPTTNVTYNAAQVLAANGFPTLDYTIQSTQEDLIAAAVNNQYSTSVIIPMKHILSQVNFGVKGYYGAQIAISNIKINKVLTTGNFNMGTWLWTNTAAETDYTYTFPTFKTPGTATTPADENGYTYIFGDGGNWGPGSGTGKTNTWYVTAANTATQASTITTGTAKLSNSLMLMPQSFTNKSFGATTSAYVTFDYTIQDLAGAYVVGTSTTPAQGKFDLNFASGAYANAWSPNLRYVYIIDFTNFLNGQQLTFDVNVEMFPWENYDWDGNTGTGTGIVYVNSLGEPIFTTEIQGLTNGGSRALPAGNVYTDNTWDWSPYKMTNTFTTGQSFTVNFSAVKFNGNTITVIAPQNTDGKSFTMSPADGIVGGTTGETAITFTAQ